MDTIEESKQVALHYFETLVDVARESFLILNSDIRVISANQVFYQNFQVTPVQTENRLLYELGNGQWNIPELKKLLEEILPEKKVVKDYKVSHVFETIGEKTILLNARQIDTVQLIVLAMEDITVRSQLEKKMADFNKELAAQVVKRTEEISNRVKELEEMNSLMIGREMNMVELKEKIKTLEAALGQKGAV